MRFAAKLSLWIDRRDLNQSRLARRIADPSLKLTQVAISEMTRGERKPSLKQGLALARALGLTLDFLADDDQDEPVPALTPDERSALALYQVQGAREGPSFTLAEYARRISAPAVPDRARDRDAAAAR